MQVQLDSEQGAANAAERVTAAYGVSALLAQADMVVTRSLMADLPDSVGFTQRQQLRQIIDKAYATATLTDAVQQQLQQHALHAQRVRDLADAAKMLETPLAQRLRGLQDKVGGAGFAADYNAFIKQSHGRQREARLSRIDTLMQAMAIVDVQTAFHVTLLTTMLHTRNAVTPSAQDISQANITKQVQRNRRMLNNQLREQLPPILLYVYRKVDNDDLRDYVQMQVSSAMKWTNQALAEAIRSALEQAGQQLLKKAEAL